ncbi:TonB-dependent receptor [Ampullimonas aquatilis]|uniref:TonB-dependent receptor n=1 Tax=Ampullimonas aquatilis TaxID=1341549 RepID=UPI003C73150E
MSKNSQWLKRRHVLTKSILTVGSLCGVIEMAQAEEKTLSEVQVNAPRQLPSTIKVTEDVEASPASVTVITKKDLDKKTITSYGDIFRGVTGVSIAQYGQGTVAYEIKARGFASGHGRDLAVFLDGMPLNVTGSQHTNGYMDLAQLIPEIVSRVEFVRGPFSVFAGNHAVGGSVQFYTDASPQSAIKLTVDNEGQARVVPVLSKPVGDGSLLLAMDGTKGDGYTKQSDLKRLNLFTRYMLPVANGLASVRFQAYDADAQAPGYLDLAAIQSGQVDKRAALSKGIGDAKSQQNLVFNYRSNDVEGVNVDGGWFVVAYLNNDIRKRWTNFDLTTPVGSSVTLGQERDQLRQFGFDIRKTLTFQTGTMPSQFVAGVQYNDERVNARKFNTDADHNQLAGPGDVISVDRRVQTQTQALYAQYQIQPISVLKLTAALRYDRLKFNLGLHPDDDTFTAAALAGLPGSVSTAQGQWSPKLGGALTLLESPGQRVELYANMAHGLKSPYPFSDYYSNLGVSGTLPDLKISSVRSYETGLQGGTPSGSAAWRIALWNTLQDKESDVNNAGIFQSFKQTRRDGFDLEGSIAVLNNLRLFANYSHVTARIKDPVIPGANYIPNVPQSSTTLGFETNTGWGAHRLDFSLADTLTGEQPLTADNQLRSGQFNRYVARAAYSNTAWHGASAFVSLVGYDKQFEEVQFDFGGGARGVSPRPKMQLTVGIQVPL